MTEAEWIISGISRCFQSWKGKRIALFDGIHRDRISEALQGDCFLCGTARDSAELAALSPEAVILTDHRRYGEPDYEAARVYCEEKGIPLFDPFGLEQLQLHRELAFRAGLSLYELQRRFAPYDVISFPVPHVASVYDGARDQLMPRTIFRALLAWMQENGKDAVFFWRGRYGKEAQKRIVDQLAGRVEVLFLERTGEDLGYGRLKSSFPQKRILHAGFETVADGILPREQGLDALLLDVYGAKSDVNPPPFPHRELLLSQIQCHDVISFDIFDTLLTRQVLAPEDIFFAVEEKCACPGFSSLRAKAQGIPYATFAEMYGFIACAGSLMSEQIALLQAAERAEELSALRPRTAIVQMLSHALGLGKTVVLTSDMYYTAAELKELLLRKGVEGYESLFVSCEHRMLKQDGLFDTVRAKYPGRSILHIGDSISADYGAALAAGLDPFWIPSPLEAARQAGYGPAIEEASDHRERARLWEGIGPLFNDPFAGI